MTTCSIPLGACLLSLAITVFTTFKYHMINHDQVWYHQIGTPTKGQKMDYKKLEVGRQLGLLGQKKIACTTRWKGEKEFDKYYI